MPNLDDAGCGCAVCWARWLSWLACHLDLLVQLRRVVAAEPLIWPAPGPWAGVRPGVDTLRDETLAAVGRGLIRDVSVVRRLQIEALWVEADRLIGVL